MRARSLPGKLLLGLGLLLLAAILLLTLFPLWFPWVLKPFAERSGAIYAHYERNGYGRFTLRDVGFTNAQVQFHAAEVQAPTPAAWLWHIEGPGARNRAHVQIQDWSLTLLPPKAHPEGLDQPAPGEKPEEEPEPWAAQFNRALVPIRKWLPEATLLHGTVQSGKTRMQVLEANWTEGLLEAEFRLQDTGVSGSLTADTRSHPYALQFNSETLALSLKGTVATNEAGLALRSTALWRSNLVTLTAQLPPNSYIPISARVDAPDMRVPLRLLMADSALKSERMDRVPAELRGAAEATWTNGAFDARLTGSARSGTDEPLPWDFGLHVHGTTNEAVLRSAFVSLPWLKASLAHNTVLLPRSPWLRDPAQLSIQADLNQQEWIDARGKVQASALVQPKVGAAPIVDFALRGSRLQSARVRVASLAMEGTLDWPWLQVPALDVSMDEGRTTAHVQGAADLSRNLLKEVRFTIASSRPPPVIPPEIAYSGLELTGSLRGPFSTPAHELQLQTTIRDLPGARPLHVWFSSQGAALESTNFSLRVAPGSGTELRFSGAAAWTNNTLSMLLRELALETNTQIALASTNARIEIVPGASGRGWSANLFSLGLSGPGGNLHADAHLQWPEQGRAQLTANGFSPAIVENFLERPVLPVRISSLVASAVWSNSPVNFSVAASVAGTSTNFPFQGEGRIRGNEHGLNIEQFAILEQGASLASLRGRFPLTLVPAHPTNLIQIDPAGTLDMRATARPHQSLWPRLKGITGVEMENPNLAAELSGTWAAPVGRVDFKAASLELPRATAATPRLTALDVSVRAEGERLLINRMDFKVQDQPVSLVAEVPLGEKFWRAYQERRIPDWTQASARLQMRQAPISAFEPLAPQILSAQGVVDVNLLLRPGGEFAGSVSITNARTDSIGTLGPVRSINLNIRLTGREAHLAGGTARIGGSLVTVSGVADLNPTKVPLGAVPNFNLSIQGANVPLSRQPDGIIRANLDLQVIGTNQAPPLVVGRASLTNSYYLSDLAALVPGKVADPRRRPPYFSITEKPLASWRLAVQVGGSHGLRVRSPLFTGEATPNLRLSGTLRDPIAVGDVRIDSGLVRFPFGSLTVQQGLVTALPQDPARPQLDVTAAARQFGYDIRMEVTGPITAPILQFSSTPPLTSDQVLLMLTAGQFPRGSLSLTPQQRAQSFAVFIGRDLLSKLGVEQGEERLIFRSGEEFSDEGRPTYDLEYKLNDRWSVTGEYDRFGDFNAGLKWRVFSK